MRQITYIIAERLAQRDSNMTYVRSQMFNAVGLRCIDLTSGYTETLEEIGERTVADLVEDFGVTAVRAGIDDVLSSGATDEELDKAWQHTGARIWFDGGTRHYFQTLKEIADRLSE